MDEPKYKEFERQIVALRKQNLKLRLNPILTNDEHKSQEFETDIADIKPEKAINEQFISGNESLESLNFFVDNANNHAVIFFDVNGNIISWNSGAERIYLYDSKEIIGKYFSLFFCDIDKRNKIPQLLLEKAKTDGQVVNEGWRKKKNGFLFWETATIVSLKKDDGAHFGFVKISHVLTERKNVEIELREKQEQIENQNEELIQINEELDFQTKDNEKRAAELIVANKELVFQNEEKEKRAAELIVANKELIFQNEEKEKRADELIIANKELVFQNEEKGKRADELNKANIEIDFQNEEKGKRAGELNIANIELDYQNDEKEKRADELNIANIELDYQNEEKGKRASELIIANKELVFQNEEKEKRAAELIVANKELVFQNEEKEKRAAELIIANKELLFQNEEKEKRAAELIVANKELLFQNEEKIKRADELELKVEERTKELEEKNTILTQQIEEKTRLTNELELNQLELQKAKQVSEDANKMKSEFLANMSHEIRTPLNAIVGFSNILKEKVEGDKVFSEYLDNIIQSSGVLLNLINDILDISKVEAGRMVINLQPVNLNDLIKEIQTVFLMRASEKGIVINIDISQRVPEVIITDEKFLRQILFNIIGNAIKFTHSGNVSIFVDIVPKEQQVSKIEILFSVEDSGIGISEQNLSIIFEPFTQVSHKEKNKYGGTGLGLSITRRLVELLGGAISAKSEFGKGSVFNVTLFDIEVGIINLKNSANRDKSHLKNIRFKNPLLLIAEDVHSNRQIIKGYLEEYNISIIETENGEDCIAAARKIRPDIILMDLQMPVMDGYTATNIIKNDIGLKNIPIIALTASGMKHEKDKFSIVVDDLLLKPINKYELIELLIKYLPYERIIELKKPKTLNCSFLPCSSVPLKIAVETKAELLQKFMPKITKLQKILNFDELIEFANDLEIFIIKNEIGQLNEHCAFLKEQIASYNVEQIINTLKNLSTCFNT